MQKQPSIYIPHGGGPAFFMEGELHELFLSMQGFLESLPEMLPQKPTAILLLSAHWETPEPTLTSGESPSLIYDYYGFPEETYALKYPARGEPSLAKKIADLLDQAGIANRLDSDYGYDHGVFIPLKVIYPDADIPVVAMSLKNNLDPNEHSLMGEALAPLRDENVLIIGSGMSYHNMESIPDAAEVSKSFDDWLSEVLQGNITQRRGALNQWLSVPKARLAHPREEHLIPLMLASGAGSDLAARKIWQDTVGVATVSAWAFD